MFKRPLFSLMLLGLLLTAAAPLPTNTPAEPGEVSVTQQMFIMKALKPDVERVGILVSTGMDDQEGFIAKVQRAATSIGVQVFLSEVGDMQDVAGQFRTLTRKHKVQILWVVQDDDVVGHALSKTFLVEHTMKGLIPIMAPSRGWVDAGATVMLTNTDGTVRLVVNKPAFDALALQLPEKYLERTEYLSAK